MVHTLAFDYQVRYSQREREVRAIRHAVYGLLLAVFLLMGFGIVAVYSASVNLPTQVAGTFSTSPLLAQSVRALVAVMVLFVIARMPSRFLYDHHTWCLGLAILLLCTVWFPGLGRELNGARRWIGFGGVSFQPSEVAKILFVVYLGGYLARLGKVAPSWKEGLVPPLVALGVVATLVLAEPDLGTTVLLCGVTFVMLTVAGARPLRLVIVASGLLIPIVFYAKKALTYVEHRFSTFLDPDVNTQVWHSVHAIGSGGLFGRGLGAGVHKLHFIPQINSDFVIAVIGEELGFMGLTLLIGLYVSVVLCGLRILLALQNRFAFLVGTGVLLLLSTAAVINIAVATAIAPAKGIALPFISAGGTAMVTAGVGVGLLVAFAREEILARCHGRPTSDS